MLLLAITLGFLVLVSVLLITLVMSQNSKEHLASETLGTTGLQQMVGTAQLPDVLEKLTYGVGTLFFLLVCCSSLLLKQRARHETEESPNLEQVASYTTPSVAQDTEAQT